jgi:pyruvate formate lyase activating enzyme
LDRQATQIIEKALRKRAFPLEGLEVLACGDTMKPEGGDAMEAMLWESLENQIVRCLVCPHRCRIMEGKRGICGVRENIAGTLVALAYGKTAAAALDPIEKKPLGHYLQGTKTYSFCAVGCNLTCAWCQNWDLSQDCKPSRPIEGLEVSPQAHVDRALRAKSPSISYTYTEPIVWFEYALDTMKLARANGLKNIWVTAGFASDETLDLILPYLDAANVDYKGTTDAYSRWCGATSEPVLHTIERMRGAGVHVEVTTLVVPGVNDDDDSLKRMAENLFAVMGEQTIWHLSRFFPNYRKTDVEMTPLSTLRRAEAIGKAEGIKTIHLGNVW